MRNSRHNIFSKIKDSQDYFLVNLLSGNADILNPEEAQNYQSGVLANQAAYTEKGYQIVPEAEEKKFKLAYLDFLDRRDADEIQIFYVPWYACNFNCNYCYQIDYAAETGPEQSKVIDAFFDYLLREFAGRRKYLTLFGGEPLLHGDCARNTIQYFVKKSVAAGLDLAVVTNGFHLVEYLDVLKAASIREIQVTLDGTQSIHDQRRFLKNGTGTFGAIVEGVDQALNAGLSINLRVVVDKENIGNLIELAHFAIEKGWTAKPNFKTQLGRNYELHTCQADPEKLLNRVSLYEGVYEIIKKYQEFLKFYRPAFSITKYLWENGELPQPLFDSCPGTKTEWAFDFTGKIFSCTATVGKSGEALGTFFPSVSRDEKVIEKWQDRDVTSIPECRDCALQLACGGGCAAVGKNKTGKILTPDCRPIKELLEMGMAIYFQKENEQ